MMLDIKTFHIREKRITKPNKVSNNYSFLKNENHSINSCFLNTYIFS